jgi:hypothetical protein
MTSNDHDQEVARLRRDLEVARRDRDRMAVLLLEAEQRVAELVEELRTLDVDRQAAIRTLQDELAELRASTSWRATAPIRAVTGAVRGRK